MTATASFTLSASPMFPAGTVVGAYLRTAWSFPSASSGPVGSPVATATVADDTVGNAVFTGLEYETRYYAAAQVSGLWRFVSFQTIPDGVASVSRVEEVAAAVVAAQADADAAQVDADAAQATADAVGLASAKIAFLPINVKNAPYSAVGDGTTDDTAALQAALDAASTVYVATGCRQEVHLPAGKYRVRFARTHDRPSGYAVFVTGCLQLKAGVSITGVRGQTEIVPDALAVTTLTAQLASGDTTVNVTSTSGFVSVTDVGLQFQCETTTSTGSYTGVTSTTLTGVTYSGPTLPAGTKISPRVFRAVFMTDCASQVDDWSISGVRVNGQNTAAIEQLHEAVIAGPSKNWRVSDCEITGMQGKGVHVIGETTGGLRIPSRWVVERCHIHAISGNAIAYSQAGAADFLISDNLLADNLLGGAEAIIAGSQTAIDRGVIARNRVVSYGDIAATGRDMVVEGNTVLLPSTALGPAVAVANGRNVKVIGNTLDCSAGSSGNNNGVAAATSAVAGLVVAGNTIRRPAAASGIATQLSSGTHSKVVVSGNIISGGGSNVEADISLNQTVDSLVTGNATANNPAIYAKSGCSRISISGNNVKGGEIIVQAASSTVSGNAVEALTGSGAVRVLAAGCVVSGNYLKGGGTSGIMGVILVSFPDCVVSGNILENAAANNRWINESGSADRNLYVDNVMIGTNGNVNLVGTASRIKRNGGYITDASGASSLVNGGTVSHGLSKTPTRVNVTASAADRRVAVTALSSTTFTVSLTDGSGAAIAVAETVYWAAEG